MGWVSKLHEEDARGEGYSNCDTPDCDSEATTATPEGKMCSDCAEDLYESIEDTKE